MTADKTYNGWTNYETWVVNLWMTNEEGSYNYYRERAEEVKKDNTEDDGSDDGKVDIEQATHDLADILKDEFEEGASERIPQGTVWADLIGAALSEVDWREIAEHLLED